MSIFGLKEAEVTDLVRRATRTDESAAVPDREAVQTAFARAAWSGIAEPGDSIAVTLVGTLGAAGALAALLEQRSADDLAVSLSGELAAEQLSDGLARWRPRLRSDVAMHSLSLAIRCGATLVTPEHEEWPASLHDLGPHAPLALWVRGTDEAFGSFGRSVSLVGARQATRYGEQVTIEAAAGLVERGYSIVSGAAFGIDGMAHRSALASDGTTLAFLAGGVDRFYPAAHEELLTTMTRMGAVISELPCGAAPTRWRFLQRNRLIAAASLATVVIEAGWRSGSLNTASHAAHLGRPLGAVPGPVTSSYSAGCHRLLREGVAVCVTSAEEMAELAPLMPAGGDEPGEWSDPRQMRVVDALSVRTARTVDEIAAFSGMAPEEVRGILGVLDLDGAVISDGVGFRLASRR